MLIAALLSVALPAQAQSWPDVTADLPLTSEGRGDAAVIVGISEYFQIADVPGAAENALDWRRYLTSRGVPVTSIHLLTNAEATRESMLAEAAWAADQVQHGGKVWFVYVGHGAPAPDGRDGLLVGADAEGSARSLAARSARRSEVLSALAAGEQSETVVVLDACFSGKASGSAMIAEGLQPVIPTALATVGAATVLSAGKSDQLAGPLPGLGRPAFSYLTLGAMRGWGDADGDGRVTATEAVEYSGGALSALVTDRRQEPEVMGQRVNLVLGTGRDAGPDFQGIANSLIDRGPHNDDGRIGLSASDGGDATSPVLGTLKWIPPGTFTMGSPSSQPKSDVVEPPHEVTLTSGFWMMELEVTQGMWQSVMGNNPSFFSSRGDAGTPQDTGGIGWCSDANLISTCGDACPVERVSWTEAVDFAGRLSSREGVTYRLPTEAEWEYAARGGESYIYAGSNTSTSVGWLTTNSDCKTHPGCQKARNGYGLCDMTGNVWEWTGDWYGSYPSSSVADPVGVGSGEGRVMRGGGWSAYPVDAGVAHRSPISPDAGAVFLGLRLVRTIP